MNNSNKHIWRVVALAMVAFFGLLTQSHAGFFSEIMEARRLTMGLMGAGGIVVAVAFATTRWGSKKSNAKIAAYEAELDKFRRSIRK